MSLQAAVEVMVFVGVYMKWVRPLVDKIFGTDVPPSYLDPRPKPPTTGSYAGPL
jgi:hypothetical protein